MSKALWSKNSYREKEAEHFALLSPFSFLLNLDWFWANWHFSSGLDNFADLRREITQIALAQLTRANFQCKLSRPSFVPWRQNIKTLPRRKEISIFAPDLKLRRKTVGILQSILSMSTFCFRFLFFYIVDIFL